MEEYENRKSVEDSNGICDCSCNETMKIKIRRKIKLPISYLHFGMLLALCMACYMSPGRLLIDIFMTLMTACIMDGIYFIMTKNQLQIYVDSGPAVEKNEIYSLQIKTENRSYLPSPFFYIKFHQSKRLIRTGMEWKGMLLGPKRTLNEVILYQTLLSGEATAGIEYAVLSSFLGFFKVKIPLEMYVKVRILPEIREIKGIEHFSHTLNEMEEDERTGSVEELKQAGEDIGYELRPYLEGDSQRLIHWKIAALKDIYLVRQREGCLEQKSELFFILNPLQQEADEEKAAILQDKTAASFISLADHYLRQGQSVSVACYVQKDWKYMKLRTALEVRGLQELLSRYHAMQVNEKLNEKMLMKSLSAILSHHGGIKIMVSAYEDSQLLKIMFSSKQDRMIVVNTALEQVAADEAYEKWYWHITEQYSLEH